MGSFRMIVEQLKEMKGAIILMGSLVAFGFWVRPEVEKIAKPLRDIADTMESLEHKVDSIGKWSEMRFIGTDMEVIRLEGRIDTNKELIIYLREN